MVDFVKFEESTKKKVKIFHFGKYSFSNIEIFHLSFAFIMISLTLMVFQKASIKSIGIINFFIINFFTIGLGFLLHELGHKFVAQYYGFISEFRADFFMMFLSFALAIFSPIIFLAPGAVMILGRVTRRQNGIISLAGPFVNLILAGIFLLLFFSFMPTQNSLFFYILWTGVWINSFLGLFNMLPFWILDGRKVLDWNPVIFFVMFGIFAILLYSTYTGFIFGIA